MEAGFLDRSIEGANAGTEQLMHGVGNWLAGWGVCVRVGLEPPRATGSMGGGEGFSCSKNLSCFLPGGWHPRWTCARCSLISAPL